jgi:hypothetical protein
MTTQLTAAQEALSKKKVAQSAADRSLAEEKPPDTLLNKPFKILVMLRPS